MPKWTVTQGDFSRSNLCWIVFCINFEKYTNQATIVFGWGNDSIEETFKILHMQPSKNTRYCLLVEMVCESETGCICNMNIHTAEGKTQQETALSALGPHLGIWHHIYQDNCYNATLIAELLQNKTRLCGTIRESRGLSLNLEMKTSQMKNGDIFFRRDDTLFLAWKDKWLSLWYQWSKILLPHQQEKIEKWERIL